MPYTHEEILAKLKQVEAEHNVRVVYACEAGSRVWGFSSQDSDYDVRFIYVRPSAYYVSADPKKRDVIECPISEELDISGWDVQKAAFLLYKSNPALAEWLHSTIVYVPEPPTISLRGLADQYMRYTACRAHYLAMAKRNYFEHLAERPLISVKKCLYVLRSLMAVIWMDQKVAFPPLDFSTLLAGCIQPDTDLYRVIRQLFQTKTGGTEAQQIDTDQTLLAFILQCLDALTVTALPESKIEYPQAIDAYLAQITDGDWLFKED